MYHYLKFNAMAIRTLEQLKAWFNPKAEQVWDWMDSFWHKEEKIPVESVEDLPGLLGGKATKEELNIKYDKFGGEIEGDVILRSGDWLGGRVLKQQIAGYDSAGIHFNRSVAEGVWSQVDIYTQGSQGYERRMQIGENLLRFNDQDVWHAGNFAPAGKVDLRPGGGVVLNPSLPNCQEGLRINAAPHGWSCIFIGGEPGSVDLYTENQWNICRLPDGELLINRGNPETPNSGLRLGKNGELSWNGHTIYHSGNLPR